MILKVGASYYINGLYECSSDLIYNHPPWTMEYIHVLSWLLHICMGYIHIRTTLYIDILSMVCGVPTYVEPANVLNI